MVRRWITIPLILVNVILTGVASASIKEGYVSLCGCSTGYYESNRFLVYSSVLPKCYEKIEKTEDTTCKGFQIYASECLPCHESCEKCFWGSEFDCLECREGYYTSTIINNDSEESSTTTLGTESTSEITVISEKNIGESVSTQREIVDITDQLDITTTEHRIKSIRSDDSFTTSVLSEEELIPTVKHKDKIFAERIRNERSTKNQEETALLQNEDNDESSGDVENDNKYEETFSEAEGENAKFVAVFDEEEILSSSSKNEDDYNEPLVKREYPDGILEEVNEFTVSTEVPSDVIFKYPTAPLPISSWMPSKPNGYNDITPSLKEKMDASSLAEFESTTESTRQIPVTTKVLRPSRRSRPRTRSQAKYTRTPTVTTPTSEILTSSENSFINSTTLSSENRREKFYKMNGYEGDFKNRSTFRCVSSCPDETYLDKKVCKKCSNNCKNCIGPSIMNCTSCSTGNVISAVSPTGSFTCTSNCLSHYFNNSGTCLPCHSFCNECIGPNQNQCIQCHEGYVKTKESTNGVGTCEEDKYSMASLEIILPLSFVVFLIIVTVLIWIRWHMKFTTLTKPFVNVWMKYIMRRDNGQDIANISALPKNTTPSGKNRNEYTSDPSSLLCAKCGSEKTDDGYELPVPSSSNGDQSSQFKSLTMRSRRNNDPLPPTPDDILKVVQAKTPNGEFYINEKNRSLNKEKEPVASGSRDFEPQPGTSRSSSRMVMITDNHYANSEGLYANC